MNGSETGKNIGVIGAGPMGLALAYYLCQGEHRVTIYEAGPVIGGMSASFDFSGTSIERYYHFICAGDKPMFALLRELGLEDALSWRETRMGYFINGTMHEWGNPVALLRLPNLDPVSKFRYGLHAFLSTKRHDWRPLDSLEATSWIRRWVGKRAYDLLWRRLFELKFYEYSQTLSAAWIWTRIKRVGTSRYNLMREKLGYLEGGSDTLLSVLRERIEDMGGKILLRAPVEKVLIEDGAVVGIRVRGSDIPHDAVFSTAPLPFVPDMIPDLPQDVLSSIRSLKNLAVICVIFKLRKPLTDKFWVNINDDRMDIPGIVEYTNLRPMDHHIVYVPYYMPGDHPKYQENNDTFIAKSWRYLRMMNSELTDDDLVDSYASRYRYSQPVCHPGHLERLPPVETPVRGLFVADTSYYYPEDRGISESVRFARVMADMMRH